ncbi:MAG: hypothetical protein A2W31_14995 [Planctomycetes bacterium RBG_16_64_10]|nr:MAG: hypothetical protein A2W31_14995 [Planctomycetes bacterium RBG_16_64_10]
MTTKERNCQGILRGACGLVGAGWLCLGATAHAAPELNPVRPRVIALDFAVAQAGKGSVVTADCDGDGRMDFVVTAPGHVGAYRMSRPIRRSA